MTIYPMYQNNMPQYGAQPNGYPAMPQQPMQPMSAPMQPNAFYGYPNYPQQMPMAPYPMMQNPAPVKPVRLTMQHDMKEKSFTLHDVDNINAIQIDSPNLNYRVLKNNKVPGEFKVNFDPKGDEHEVKIFHYNQPVKGTPFRLLPKPASIKFSKDGMKTFSVQNIHKLDQLKIDADTLKYDVYQNEKEPTTYDVHFQPNDMRHHVKVLYKGKMVDGGDFHLAPRPQPQMPVTNYAAQPVMAPNYMMPQQYPMHPPVQAMYGQPMYAPPAYNAPAPANNGGKQNAYVSNQGYVPPQQFMNGPPMYRAPYNA